MDKTTLNAIRALRRKPERTEQGRFVVEGDKGVAELVESSIAVERMYYVSTMEHAVPDSHRHVAEQISVKDMGRISQMNTAPGLLAVASIPERAPEEIVQAVEGSPMAHGLIACRLQDPGNLGTLIRTADWFGFGGVFITEDTVDPWNAKTVQASMGSIFRIPVVEAPMDFCTSFQGIFTSKCRERRIQPSRGRAVGYGWGPSRMASRGSTFPPHPFPCTFRASDRLNR